MVLGVEVDVGEGVLGAVLGVLLALIGPRAGALCRARGPVSAPPLGTP